MSSLVHRLAVDHRFTRDPQDLDHYDPLRISYPETKGPSPPLSLQWRSDFDVSEDPWCQPRTPTHSKRPTEVHLYRVEIEDIFLLPSRESKNVTKRSREMTFRFVVRVNFPLC